MNEELINWFFTAGLFPPFYVELPNTDYQRSCRNYENIYGTFLIVPGIFVLDTGHPEKIAEILNLVVFTGSILLVFLRMRTGAERRQFY